MEAPAVSKEAKRKLMREGSMVCPISGWKGPLVMHHIHGREVRNAESGWNIAWVSPNVHQAIHCGEIIIEGWRKTTEGRQLIWHHAGERSITGENAQPPLYDG